MNRLRRHTKKVFIGFIGGLVTVIGLVLIPYPGPGWLIVFGGLAILATEFTFAAKVLEFAKGRYEAWVRWLKRQNIVVKILVLALTGAVVVVTLWLMNAFGIVNNVLDLRHHWLVSPLFR